MRVLKATDLGAFIRTLETYLILCQALGIDLSAEARE